MDIPETHPLQQLFLELVGRHYAEEIGIRDPQIVKLRRTSAVRVLRCGAIAENTERCGEAIERCG